LGGTESTRSAVDKLIRVHRPHAAAILVAHNQNAFTSERIIEILNRVATEPWPTSGHETDTQMFKHYLERLLQTLDTRRDVDAQTIGKIEWAFFEFLDHSQRSHAALHETLSSEPDFFASVISLVYRPASVSADVDAMDESNDKSRTMFERAYRLLRDWRRVPGAEGAVIDGGKLDAWIDTARDACKKIDREDVADQQIGHVLAFSVSDSDGAWPPAPVRALIERQQNPNVERGIFMGLIDKRGPTWRSMTEGGDPERSIAAGYRKQAREARFVSPRTSAMLNRIVEYYEAEARRYDEDNERRNWS
jgi:hypothetical protein